MKTKIYLALVVICFTFYLSKAQTVTSVSNGDWMNPFTWSCTCIPVLGYNASSITINNNVVLDTSMAVSSGTLTVSSYGTLSYDIFIRDILINGGTFINNGSTDVRYIMTQTGSFTNYGTLHVSAFLNYVTFANYGSIVNADSISNFGYFINHPGSSLYVDSLSNYGTFLNYGVETHTAFTNFATFSNHNYIGFYDFTNFGTYINTDSLVGSNSFFNTGIFKNQTAAVFTLSNSFLNADSLNHDAVFENEGIVTVGNNWYNSDTVSGIQGWFTVQNLSGNSGYMTGSFDFCDLTPTAITPPFIDYNTGIVSPDISFCIALSVEKTTVFDNFSLFPNPVRNTLNIKTSCNTFVVDILNITGENVYSVNNISQIDLSRFASGMYIFIAKDNSGTILYQQRFVKE